MTKHAKVTLWFWQPQRIAVLAYLLNLHPKLHPPQIETATPNWGANWASHGLNGMPNRMPYSERIEAAQQTVDCLAWCNCASSIAALKVKGSAARASMGNSVNASCLVRMHHRADSTCLLPVLVRMLHACRACMGELHHKKGDEVNATDSIAPETQK